MHTAAPAIELERRRDEIKQRLDTYRKRITVCTGTACQAYECLGVFAAIEEEIGAQGLESAVEVRKTGCHGFCERGTWVAVQPEDLCYQRVQPHDAAQIVAAATGNGVVESLLYADPVSKTKIPRGDDIPFYKHQQRTLLAPNRIIDPANLDHYLSIDGYRALAKALLCMTPEEVITEIGSAELRGRGGGGFPTAKKWRTARDAPAESKYVIVNCDEGDPGAYMDRSLMEGNPHAVLEGLLIGGYAVGASQGVVYVRWEYPLATRNIQIAIEQAAKAGLLGNDILGSGFDFHVEVHRGAGAFVSGEETAMIAAIEGKVGEPRLRYVYPAVRGLNGKPTVVNNVETWATVPAIVDRGAEWFRSIGTAASKGTKIFSLVGRLENTGLIEVPMGTTLRELVYEIGGGIPNRRKFKALQIGGPSGGMLGPEHLDTPVDFEALAEVGAMMGSGGIVVMDEGACVVSAVRDLVSFCRDECCGKCTPGREGLRILGGYFDDICGGRADESVIAAIEDVTHLMRVASLCALGVTAINPVVTSLRGFRGEYEAHIRQRRCPAKVCTELVEYHISQVKCDKYCTSCLSGCPTPGAIVGHKGVRKRIEQDKCIKCGVCEEVCPTRFSAVARFSGEPIPAAFRKGR